MINITRISWKNKELEFILCQWPNIVNFLSRICTRFTQC